MTQRETAIALMRVAGYHEDQRERVRLLVESRVNREVMDTAWQAGRIMRARGVPCSCHECRMGGQ